MHQLILSEEHRPLLLEMCKDLFPETKMLIFPFSEGYKGHAIEFFETGNTFSIFGNMTKSPNMILGFYQQELGDHSIGYEQTINIHWYELCMSELAMRLYNEEYNRKMKILFNEDVHIIDFLYSDFKENKNFNFIT